MTANLGHNDYFSLNIKRWPLKVFVLIVLYLVVHDGSQAHDAYMYVIPLAGGRLLMHFVPEGGADSGVTQEHM